MSKPYRISRTPEDEAEQLWRDLQRAQHTASTPMDWMRVSSLMGQATIAFQRAVLWRLGALDRAIRDRGMPRSVEEEQAFCAEVEEAIG